MPRNTAVLDRLRGDRDEARNAAIALAESDDFDPTADAYTALEERATNLDGQIERLVALMGQQDAADALDGRLGRAAQQQDRDDRRNETREQSIGELFTRSDVFTTYPGRGTSSRFELQDRALPLTTTGFADVIGSGPKIDLSAPDLGDLIVPMTNVITVSQNSIEYVSYAKTAGGADIVAEGALKPSAEWAPTVTPAALDNIAVHTQMTRQLIEDASAVRSYIDGELRREVTRKAEEEAVDAIAAATLPTVAGPSGSGLSGAIRAAKGKVQAAGFRPNAVLIHPDDAVAVDVDSVATFRGDPYWGLTPVMDPNATPGTVTVGDYKAGVHHYQRSSVSLYITDSHADTFLKNVFTLLAEQRSKTVVVRPAALSEGTVGI